MSAEAQARLQQIWEKLHFSRVKRTIGREPEDILSIYLKNTTTPWSGPHYSSYKRVSDVPAGAEIDHIAWRHYYGFTDDGIFFHKSDYHGLDLDIDLTMTWSHWGNHTGGWDRPEDGEWICGKVVETPRGKRFTKWFTCDEAFRLLVEAVRDDVLLSEDELGRRLLTDDYPDKFWAITRLVLFDNVQAFVDECKLAAIPWDSSADKSFARHPAAGKTYGTNGYECSEHGMFLPMAASKFVHLMSHRLDHTEWWQEFLRLSSEQSVKHSHPGMGDACAACRAEAIASGGFDYDEYGF